MAHMVDSDTAAIEMVQGHRNEHCQPKQNRETTLYLVSVVAAVLFCPDLGGKARCVSVNGGQVNCGVTEHGEMAVVRG